MINTFNRTMVGLKQNIFEKLVISSSFLLIALW